jgi:hypothetical protein
MSIQPEMSDRFLGRLFDTHKEGDLYFAKYIDKPTLLESSRAPLASNWKDFLTPAGFRPTPDTDPLGNDVLGDCVFAAIAHMINMIGKLTGNPTLVVTANMVKTEYLKRTGGQDTGYYVRSMLEIALKEGIFGAQLTSYCAVNKDDPDEVALALWLGGGLIGGYDLPIFSQGSTDEQGRQLWYSPASGWPTGQGPGTWGGHCLYQRGTSPGMDDYNSWGEDTEATVGWRRDCCSELWLPLFKEWRCPDDRAPNGFAYQDLLADVRARGV